jgi:hypothetical protein
MTVVDENTGLPATIFSSIGGAALTNPFFADSEGFAQFYAASGTYRVTANDTGTGQSITWRYIRFGDAASRDVGTASGNVMEVGAGGLLTGVESNPAYTGDVFLISTTEFQRLASSAANIPVSANGYISSKFRNANNVVLLIEYDDGRVFRNTKNVSWSGWQEIYHSGNLNPNVFGGSAIDDVIAIGYAESSTIGIFNFPVSRTPVSLTNNGTFTVSDASNNVLSTGVTLSFGVTSSDKLAVGFTAITGATAGQALELKLESPSGNITVNS